MAPLRVDGVPTKDGRRFQARAGERRGRMLPKRPYVLPDDLLPTQVDGKWRRPRISGRMAAELRKRAVREGTFGSYDPVLGLGWLSAWDEQRSTRIATVSRPPKGRAHDNNLAKRLAAIEKGLATQAERIAEWQKTRPPPNKKTGLAVVLRRNPWEK
jgi:hypothetical protein